MENRWGYKSRTYAKLVIMTSPEAKTQLQGGHSKVVIPTVSYNKGVIITL